MARKAITYALKDHPTWLYQSSSEKFVHSRNCIWEPASSKSVENSSMFFKKQTDKGEVLKMIHKVQEQNQLKQHYSKLRKREKEAKIMKKIIRKLGITTSKRFKLKYT